MKRILSILTIPALMALNGCYYEVRDARTGRMYYTDKWVAADGYRGPLTITDQSGGAIRIQNAEVLRLNRQDYLEATAIQREQTAPPDSPTIQP